MIKKAKAYFVSLSDRDRRAVFLGTVGLVGIVLYLFVGLPLFEDWSCVRDELKMYQDRLENVRAQSPASKAKIVGLYRTVPFVELAQNEDTQRKLFWDKTYDQLRSAGIRPSSGPSYISSSRKKTVQGSAALRLKFAGSCQYEQLLKFLARLNENPYLVSIEEFSVKSDAQKPGQLNIDMTLETFVRQEAR